MTIDLTTERVEAQQQAAGPESALDALKAFKEVQERRVAHWKEYDEALEHYERTNLYADEGQAKQGESEERSSEVPGTDSAAQAHRCAAGPSLAASSSTDTSSHYHSVALPMTDAIFCKIVSLVTSGLLDCSHSVRAVETELRTALRRPDLADLVGRVQGLENAVLRVIVERDQNKRVAKLQGRDLSAAIEQLEQQVRQRRSDIEDVIADINAEMAEL